MLKSEIISIKNVFQEATSFDEAWGACQADLEALFQVEHVRLFYCETRKSELFTIVKKDGRSQEVRLPLSLSSIAGFTALSQLPLLFKTLDADELNTVHAGLSFDSICDQITGFTTRNLISVPIQHESSLLGVLQLLNKKNGAFSREDQAYSRLIASIIGQKMHMERSLTKGPYDHLVAQGALTQSQLEDALARATATGIFVSRLLQQEFQISPDHIGASLEAYYQVPFVRYEGVSVSDKTLNGINRQYLMKGLWLPLARQGDLAIVVMHNPHELEKIEDIRLILNANRYEFRVGLPEDILAFLGDTSQLKAAGATVEVEAKPLGDLPVEFENEDFSQEFAELESIQDEGFEDEQLDAEDISQESRQVAVRFVNKIIIHAYRIGASDIHIEPSKAGQPGVVRMRVDGTCERILSVQRSIINSVISRIKILSNLNISEKRLPQDGKAKVRFKGRDLELRVATLPTVYGESVVLRLLKVGGVLHFDNLNLSPRNKAEIELLMAKPHGIFLVVGPTGSGKTTTLHSILSRINTPDKKIWTVEDPVEITQAGLQQVQVDTVIGLDFARIMRAFLRADPDVILVGEMRDSLTAQIGVEASLTGHLVFSTLHTNSAAETVTRLLEMGVEAINFSEALQGILAQRLVKTLCSHCRTPHTPTTEEWELLVKHYGEEYFPELGMEREKSKIYKAAGCGRCSQSGYKGRIGIHELLVATPEVRKCITRNQTAEEIAHIAIEQGMRTLFQDGIVKILSGDIDILQLQKVASSS